MASKLFAAAMSCRGTAAVAATLVGCAHGGLLAEVGMTALLLAAAGRRAAGAALLPIEGGRRDAMPAVMLTAARRCSRCRAMAACCLVAAAASAAAALPLPAGRWSRCFGSCRVAAAAAVAARLPASAASAAVALVAGRDAHAVEDDGDRGQSVHQDSAPQAEAAH